MKIGIVYDREKPEAKKAKKLALEVKDWLKKRKHQVFLRLGNSVLEDLNLVITFGGDGLILQTANKVAAYKTPLLRVNFGYVGFLANVKPAEIFEKLSAMLDEDNYIIAKRTRIEVLVKDEEGNLLVRKDALKDIVAERINTQAIACEVAINGESNEYRGDGIIFATRTGSTAYAESAGGPTLIKDDKFILRVISPSNREQIIVQQSLQKTFFIEVGDVPKIKEEP
jgi:NAD kinase